MIITDQPAEEYHANPAYGSTTGKLALKSMQLVADHISGVHSVADKGYFQIGRLAHLMVLEPKRFEELVVCEGPINKSTGKQYGRDTNAFKDWSAENPTMTVVEPWLYTSLLRMPLEVKNIFCDGEAEVSVYQEMANGLPVKCRPDYLRGTVISDLKTINDIDDAERAIVKMKYWLSHAWYRAVMERETGQRHTFRLVFVEKKAPYRWRVKDLMADYVMYADRQVESLMGDMAAAHKAHDWKDYTDVVSIVEMPDYLDDTEDEEGE